MRTRAAPGPPRQNSRNTLIMMPISLGWDLATGLDIVKMPQKPQTKNNN